MKVDKSKDKDYLIALCNNLKISKYNIRLDECRDWYYPCKEGKIYTIGAEWFIYFNPESVRRWNGAKKLLSFLKVHQDGDDEGILSADFPLSEEQSKLVRRIMKIRISHSVPSGMKNTVPTKGV